MAILISPATAPETTGLRELQHHAKKNRWEALAYRLWKEVLRRPWLYNLDLRCARLALRPFVRDGWLSRLPGPGSGWTAGTALSRPVRRG